MLDAECYNPFVHRQEKGNLPNEPVLPFNMYYMGGTHSGIATSMKYKNGVAARYIKPGHPAYRTLPSKVHTDLHVSCSM